MSIKKLTTQEFKDQIFDYTKKSEWEYNGIIPAVIDFYADWCAPCRMVAKVIEELAVEYEGKVAFYKIDTEVEQELAAVFQIQSIPSLLFIPTQEMPAMQLGALPKAEFKRVIEERLLSSVVK
ncbi:MAG: thioredoxin fold domain-containing protein [Bacteroidota bacterium]|nr:thioredoxin fold domain-containing protein [Bacteroidota bacterium]